MCFKEVFQVYFSEVALMFHESFKEDCVLRSFKGVTWKFQRCFQSVSKVFQGIFRGVSRNFQAHLQGFSISTCVQSSCQNENVVFTFIKGRRH